MPAVACAGVEALPLRRKWVGIIVYVKTTKRRLSIVLFGLASLFIRTVDNEDDNDDNRMHGNVSVAPTFGNSRRPFLVQTDP